MWNEFLYEEDDWHYTFEKLFIASLRWDLMSPGSIPRTVANKWVFIFRIELKGWLHSLYLFKDSYIGKLIKMLFIILFLSSIEKSWQYFLAIFDQKYCWSNCTFSKYGTFFLQSYFFLLKLLSIILLLIILFYFVKERDLDSKITIQAETTYVTRSKGNNILACFEIKITLM